ncbi:helix-turn-helix domain-containing protein [Nitrosomonas ureae]|uniref:Helix-turn-helix n=1 Tax=Nitrosomonas ureae TaxID=44577 RepID=A0A286A2A9_9PROT|nr:helix-turn-helix transcriptional regulator [Nitrosomonas ureae]SOD15991.1 Helix-turn-helix [Nitrosomonas ureae]
MKMSKILRSRLEQLKETDEYWISSLKLDFALAIEEKRRETGKSYTELARSLKTSNAYISKVFSGDANFTIDSMVRIARALNCNLNVTLNNVGNSRKDIIESIIMDQIENIRSSEKKVSTYDCTKLKALNDSTYAHAA